MGYNCPTHTMKKHLLFVAALLIAATTYAAKDEVLILEEGSPAFWLEDGKFTTLDIDWSNTSVVEWDGKNKVEKDFGTIDQYNRMQGEDYVNDWPTVQKTVLSGATGAINVANKKKGLKALSPNSPEIFASMKEMNDEQREALMQDLAKYEQNKIAPTFFRDYSEAAYDIFIQVDTIDMGNGAAAAFSAFAGGASMVGTMAVKDRATQEVVCKFHINHVKGLGSYAQTARINLLFNQLWSDALPNFIKNQGKKKK